MTEIAEGKIHEVKKVRTFKKPHARKWSAELNFPDGSIETIQTPFPLQKQATMYAIHKWADGARARGIVVGKKSGNGHAAAGGAVSDAGTIEPGDTGIRLQSRCKALVLVLEALEGMGTLDVSWVFRAAEAALVADRSEES